MGMQATMTSPRGLRKATATKLLVVLGIVIVLAKDVHLYALSATRVHARAVLAQTLDGITASDAKTVTAALDAFDRMTGDIFFAATGPYLVLAILIPSLLVSLVRLHNNLTATEDVLRRIIENGGARTDVATARLASTKVNYPRNNSL
jgi:hypothetical protein